jgi:hypothetical protein
MHGLKEQEPSGSGGDPPTASAALFTSTTEKPREPRHGYWCRFGAFRRLRFLSVQPRPWRHELFRPRGIEVAGGSSGSYRVGRPNCLRRVRAFAAETTLVFRGGGRSLGAANCDHDEGASLQPCSQGCTIGGASPCS